MGVELALFEVLGARAKSVHEVAADRRVALHLTGEDGLDIGEDAIKHLGDGDQRALEQFEVTGGVGVGGIDGVGKVGGEEVD